MYPLYLTKKKLGLFKVIFGFIQTFVEKPIYLFIDLSIVFIKTLRSLFKFNKIYYCEDNFFKLFQMLLM